MPAETSKTFAAGSSVSSDRTLGPGGGVVVLQDHNPYRPGIIDINEYLGSAGPQGIIQPLIRHGTGKAGIAAGLEFVEAIPVTAGDGFSHAPESLVMSWSVSHGDSFSERDGVPGDPLTTFASTFVMATEEVAEWLLEGGERELDILNISFGGWSDPNHVTNIALDRLAEENNVLIINAAGNDGDTTESSIGAHNGLSVANVYTRRNVGEPYIPHHTSSRGPLFGDTTRFYPDISAVGAGQIDEINPAVRFDGILQPLLDDPLNANEYTTAGTSNAAPQVAGAAALYLSRRKIISMMVPPSYLELKAALLVTADDVYAKLVNAGEDQHTYLNQNTYGVGFLRDDRLASFAERVEDDVTNPANDNDGMHGELVILTETDPTKTISIGRFEAGQLVAVAFAWPRTFPPDPFGESPEETIPVFATVEANIMRNTQVVAKSFPSGNSYRYLVFRAPNDFNMKIELNGSGLPEAQPAEPGIVPEVPVYVAVREMSSFDDPANAYAGTGTVMNIPQVSSCNPGVGSVSQEITRTLPNFNTDIYGGGPVFGVAGPLNTVLKDYNGFSFQAPLPLSNILSRRIAYEPSVIDQPLPITIKELAFRFVPPHNPGGPKPSSGSIQTSFKLKAWEGNHGSPVPGDASEADLEIIFPENHIWNRQKPNEWTVRIPLSPALVFDGVLPLIIELEKFPNLELDFASYPGFDYFRTTVTQNNGTVSSPQIGFAPILGLVEDDGGPVIPTLEVVGTPAIGDDIGFFVRGAGRQSLPADLELLLGAPKDTRVFLTLAASNPNIPYTDGLDPFGTPVDPILQQCRLYTDFQDPHQNFGAMNSMKRPVPASGHNYFSSFSDDAFLSLQIPNDPSLLFTEIYCQAIVVMDLFPGGIPFRRIEGISNGLKMTIGGHH